MDAYSDQPKPKKSWLPRIRFSLRALLFVVLCAALGGALCVGAVRTITESQVRRARDAAEKLPSRWQEVKAAVTSHDEVAVETAYVVFVAAVNHANSKESLLAALGEPDRVAGMEPEVRLSWVAESGPPNNHLSVAVVYDQGRLTVGFDKTDGAGTSNSEQEGWYPISSQVMGTEPDRIILPAALGGTAGGAMFGLLVWAVWCWMRRRGAKQAQHVSNG